MSQNHQMPNHHSTVSSIDVESYYQRCSSTMQNICKTLELSQEQHEIVMKALDAYLLSELPKICECFRETLDKNSWNWEIIYEDDRFKDYADIALRLEPTPCSEASAERAIFLQRLIILKEEIKH